MDDHGQQAEHGLLTGQQEVEGAEAWPVLQPHRAEVAEQRKEVGPAVHLPAALLPAHVLRVVEQHVLVGDVNEVLEDGAAAVGEHENVSVHHSGSYFFQTRISQSTMTVHTYFQTQISRFEMFVCFVCLFRLFIRNSVHIQ